MRLNNADTYNRTRGKVVLGFRRKRKSILANQLRPMCNRSREKIFIGGETEWKEGTEKGRDRKTKP